MTRRSSLGSKILQSSVGGARHPAAPPSILAHSSLDEVRDSWAARLTVLMCSIAVVAGLVWAAWVEVEEKVTGTGTIEPQGQIERVEHPDGGVVQSLAARDNQVLPPGGVILIFDTDHIEREMTALTARITTLEDEAARVRFLLQTNGASAQVDRITGDAASEAFWTEQAFLIAQLERIEGEDARLALQAENAAARAGIILEEKKIIDAQLERFGRHANSGAIRLVDRERMQRESLQLARSLEEVEGRRAELGSARRENRQRKEELLAQRRRDAALRWTKVEEELVTLRQAVEDAVARIERASVQTATGGKVHRLDILRPNEVVRPGETIAEIVPPGTEYRAVVNVSADRIGSIRQGMGVKLKIASFDFTRFGVISAAVSDVSPTSFVNDQGEIVYRVTVDLPDIASFGGGQISIRPGMTVAADILTGKRSILSYLMTPLRRVQDESLSEA